MNDADDINVQPIRLMVASTVYHYQDQLKQICGVLSTNDDYEIWNSHYGTMPTNPSKSNLENCLQAVRDCDVFLGIIRPFYGSGVVGERSITHEEICLAVSLNKPRWFLVNSHVTFARQLLRQFHREGQRLFQRTWKWKWRPLTFAETRVLDDLRVIDMFDDATQSSIPVAQRRGHWVQEYSELGDALRNIEAQFRDAARVRTIISEMNDDH